MNWSKDLMSLKGHQRTKFKVKQSGIIKFLRLIIIINMIIKIIIKKKHDNIKIGNKLSDERENVYKYKRKEKRMREERKKNSQTLKEKIKYQLCILEERKLIRRLGKRK